MTNEPLRGITDPAEHERIVRVAWEAVTIEARIERELAAMP